jgi:hypothetical protein
MVAGPKLYGLEARRGHQIAVLAPDAHPLSQFIDALGSKPFIVVRQNFYSRQSDDAHVLALRLAALAREPELDQAADGFGS